MPIIRFLNLCAACLAAIAALATLGARIHPRLDVVTHFSVPIALIAAGTLVIALLDRERTPAVAAWVSLLALGACCITMMPDIAAGLFRSPATANAPRLRVMQFNVLYKNQHPEKAVRAILRSDADIVVLEEVAGSARTIPEGASEAYPFRVQCRCGVVILSRWPIIDDSVRHDDRNPPQAEPSIAWASARTPLGDIHVIGTHYDWPTKPQIQSEQQKILMEAVKLFDRGTLIVTGDFNSTPWSVFLRRQDKLLGLERRTRAAPSWPAGYVTSRNLPAPFPLLPIDHIYAGRDWRTVSVRRGPRAGSDHYPMIVTLAYQPAR